VLDEPVAVTPPTCGDCGRPWLDASEARAFIVAAEEREHVFEGPDEVALFRGWCAVAEFGGD
jgi:hypothetical protein